MGNIPRAFTVIIHRILLNYPRLKGFNLNNFSLLLLLIKKCVTNENKLDYEHILRTIVTVYLQTYSANCITLTQNPDYIETFISVSCLKETLCLCGATGKEKDRDWT